MRPIWKGAISFGLVTIPVQVLNATDEAEKISFKMLRKGDFSPIRYNRVAEVDGKEVPWENIVKGYEYEKGKFVIMDDKDFDKIDLVGTDSIQILDFVNEQEVEPIFFYKPYYITPQKGGGGAYSLLCEVLTDTKKIGIAKVIIRSRQHLAAVRPKGDLLMLELMRFATEIADPAEVQVPKRGTVDKRAIAMAKTLVEQMSDKWEPERYTDEYAEKMRELIDRKIAAGGKELPAGNKSKATGGYVVDLVALLLESLQTKRPAGGKNAEVVPSRIKKRSPAARKGGERAKPRPTHKHAA